VIGVRLPDGTRPRNPGEYAWMPYAMWECKPSFYLGDGEWHLIAPDGRIGAAGRTTIQKPAAHTWVEHEDGTVTFSPSLVMPSGWHGYLEAGVWRQV
jgi:hypothetical protein